MPSNCLILCHLLLLPSVFLSISSVQLSSVAQSCLTLCNPMNCRRQASLSITNSQSLQKLMSIKLVMPSSHLILCHPKKFLASYTAWINHRHKSWHLRDADCTLRVLYILTHYILTHQCFEISVIVAPILQVRKPRHREVSDCSSCRHIILFGHKTWNIANIRWAVQRRQKMGAIA